MIPAITHSLRREESPTESRRRLIDFLTANCVIRSSDEPLFSSRGIPIDWLIDTRIAILNPDMAGLIAELYWDVLQFVGPFQLACMELTGVPFMVAIQNYGARSGKLVNGFILRKERKSTGRQRRIEGTVNELPIIFIDDVMNSGTSVRHAKTVLEENGRTIAHVVAFIDFGPSKIQRQLRADGIQLHSLVKLEELGVRIVRRSQEELPSRDLFEVVWRARVPGAAKLGVITASAPVVDRSNLYFCTDAGAVCALDQISGSILWTFLMESLTGTRIISAPLVANQTICVSGAEGNLYALEPKDGSLKWAFRDADSIKASPTFAPSLNAVYATLEHATPGRQGSIVSLAIESGQKRWEFLTECALRCSPVFLPGIERIVAATVSGNLYCLDAADGSEYWSQFGLGEIIAKPIYDAPLECIFVGSSDRHIYCIDRVTGGFRWKTRIGGAISGPPIIHADNIYVTGLDKRFYAIRKEDGVVLKTFEADGKLFASPTIIGSLIYFSSTSGAVHAYSIPLHKVIAVQHFPEKLMSSVVFDPVSSRCFLSTCENRVYSLRLLNAS